VKNAGIINNIFVSILFLYNELNPLFSTRRCSPSSLAL